MKIIQFLLLTIIYALFSSMNSWVMNGNITLNPTRDYGTDERSIISMPTAFQDGNTISIYSEVTIQRLRVTVKDSMGTILLSKETFISPQQPYIFSLGTCEEGIYTLTLDDGQHEYQGYFEID